MGLSKPIIIAGGSDIDISNLATKSDISALSTTVGTVNTNVNSVKTSIASMGGMKIKSIQKGRLTTAGTASATISAVNVEKSFVFSPTGNGGGAYGIKDGLPTTATGTASSSTTFYGCFIMLRDSTTIQSNFKFGDTSKYIDWVVIEFE